MKVADWLFVSEEVAAKAGATHDGVLFGVPVWIADVGEDMPATAAKFVPAELWITVCLTVAQFLVDINLLEGIPYYVGDALGDTAGASQ